jgi:hypothetical protein
MAAQTAGAGRGKQGGPTAKQLADYERKQNAGIFTEGMPVPQDIDGASVSTPKKMAGGGDIAKQQEADGRAMVDRIMRQYQKENPANAAQVRRLTPPAPVAPRLSIPKDGVVSPQEGARLMQELDAQKQKEFDDFTAPPVTKAKGGTVSASSRGDGIAKRGKTKGRFV